MLSGSIERVRIYRMLTFLLVILIVIALCLTGAWLIHPILIFTGKIVIDTIPGMRQEVSWTLVNLLYLSVCVSASGPGIRLC